MWNDFRYAFRNLHHNAGFAATAILLIALGVGAGTAVFSVVNAVILRPLAYRHADRIVALSSADKKTGEHFQVSIPDFNDWHAQSQSFDAMAYYSNRETTVALESGGQFATLSTVSVEFFHVLSGEPALGRLFSSEEATPGASGAAVISHSFWQTHFGGDRAVLGKSVRVGARSLPIVGVMPAGFQFPGKTEVWIPKDTIFRVINPNRGGHNDLAIARLKAGVAVDQAQAEMALIGERLERQYPNTNSGKSFAVAPLREEMVGSLRSMLYLLLGAVFLLLLIACGSVANLLLARAAARTREFGVRVALGAARGRIIRQLAIESLTLGLLGGAAGLAIARFGSKALVALAPAGIPRLEEAGIDTRVLAFSVLITLLTCVLFGFAPALRAVRVNVNQALSQGGRGPLGAGSGLRGLLVMAEIAVSVVLLVGAGLLIRSFGKLTDVALGFDARQVLIMETSNPVADAAAATRVVRDYQTLLREVAAIPGVVSVAANRIPPGEVSSFGAYEVDQAAVPGRLSARSPQAVFSIVSPDAFAVLGIPIRSGRDFTDADGPDAPMTAVINETLAKRAFPGQDPVGHAIFAGMDSSLPMTVVGVAGDIRQRGPGEQGLAEIYMPYQQHQRSSTAMRIMARTSVPPASLTEALRQKARKVMPGMPVKFTTMEALMAENVAAPRFRSLLLAIFGAIAVMLTAGGVYGVLSFLVRQRTREMGLRMALGAGSRQILQMILGQGLRMAAAGLAIGLMGAALLTRFLSTLLFEVTPFDRTTYFLVALTVALITAGACLVPARRAASIEPMRALRQD